MHLTPEQFGNISFAGFIIVIVYFFESLGYFSLFADSCTTFTHLFKFIHFYCFIISHNVITNKKQFGFR